MNKKPKIDNRPLFISIRTIPIRYCNGSVIDYYNERRPMEQIPKKLYDKYIEILTKFHTEKAKFNNTTLVDSENMQHLSSATKSETTLEAFYAQLDYFYTKIPMELLNRIVDNVDFYAEVDVVANKNSLFNCKQTKKYVLELKKLLIQQKFSDDLEEEEYYINFLFGLIQNFEKNLFKTDLGQITLLLNYTAYFSLIEFSVLLYYQVKFMAYKSYLQNHKRHNEDRTMLFSHATYVFIKKYYHDYCCDKESFKTFLSNFQYLSECYIDNKYLLSVNNKHRLFKFLVCFKVYQRLILEHNLEVTFSGFILKKGHENLLEKLYYQECRNYFTTFWPNTNNASFLRYINDKIHSQFYTNT